MKNFILAVAFLLSSITASYAGTGGAPSVPLGDVTANSVTLKNPLSKESGGNASTWASGAYNVQNNSRAALYPKWRLALAKATSGADYARILFVGDSTTKGTGTSGSTTITIPFLSPPLRQISSSLLTLQR